jgi:hypothetical protein
MSSLDFDPESQMSNLESEWRQAFETSLVARAELQALAATPNTQRYVIDQVRERLNRAEALKARIMAKIERLEDSSLGND